MVVDTIGVVKSRKLLKVQFDLGSIETLIKTSAVPELANPVPTKCGKKINTIAESMSTQEFVCLTNLRLPKFNKNC